MLQSHRDSHVDNMGGQLVKWLGFILLISVKVSLILGQSDNKSMSTKVISLDGNSWLLAHDPQNVGRAESWFNAPRPDAKETKVPWIVQDVFPDKHGVFWYWRDFEAPANHHNNGRYLLRFWNVDYKADVWLNGVYVGSHEGAEEPFILDVTEAMKPEIVNRLAVRILNPTNEPIDGIVLDQTPHRIKYIRPIPFIGTGEFNHGGIEGSVELLITPAVRVEDVYVRPNLKTGVIRIETNIRNALSKTVTGRIEITVAPATSGETLDVLQLQRELSSGDTLVQAKLHIERPHLWELNDPYLYRVTVRVSTSQMPNSFDEHSVRCGFRDFRLEDGYFRLNGRRIFLRSSHTGNDVPIGLQLPHDPDILRRTLVNVKMMGFNAIRFFCNVPQRYQLELCDEIGLLVYEECYAGWHLVPSPKMEERFDRSVLAMIRRDRNHPSVVMWGLLNETPDGPVFQHAVDMLPRIRSLDDTRIVMLNSGRFDNRIPVPYAGLDVWRPQQEPLPDVAYNGTDRILRFIPGISWKPGQLTAHPGPAGEYSVVRWIAPTGGKFKVSAGFAAADVAATTDVHVLHGNTSLFDGLINLGGGKSVSFSKTVTVKKGDTIDCVVGFGNGNYGADTTTIVLKITSSDGRTYDAAADFSSDENPHGVWSYGYLPPGRLPNPSAFRLYMNHEILGKGSVGSLSNPGSKVWEDVVCDQHHYPRVPHTADIISNLRSARARAGRAIPVFVSEYGIGSAVDLVRLTRHYEQLGKESSLDARAYRARMDMFLADWKRFGMGECFASPEAYFKECLSKMAGQRLLGINAIRANPNVIGYSLTGTVDQGLTGEGLFTTFRELKPGTIDAVFDGLAPLRWCLFVEPVHAYKGSRVRLEAVLANEDALAPGEYPARLQVVGPNTTRVFERTITVKVPGRTDGKEPPFAFPVFAEDIVINGPAGKYRFLAAFERGAAAAGGDVEFYVTDPADMPPVETEVVLWGEDTELARWLSNHGIQTRRFDPATSTRRNVILVSTKPAVPGGSEAFKELARRIARGSTAVFLSPEVFRKGDKSEGWLPLKNKGALTRTQIYLYLNDEWTKRHPIFDGLPAGGLMDYTFYREVIPDRKWSYQDIPEEVVAVATNTTLGYSSGTLVSVHKLGAGHFILNTLRIRENLGKDPVAERLLRNMLRYAGRDVRKPLVNLPADFDATLRTFGY